MHLSNFMSQDVKKPGKGKYMTGRNNTVIHPIQPRKPTPSIFSSSPFLAGELGDGRFGWIDDEVAKRKSVAAGVSLQGYLTRPCPAGERIRLALQRKKGKIIDINCRLYSQ